VTLEIVFDWQGIVHSEFIPEGAVVSKDVLACLWEAVHLII
jgi:hypothetical protein